MSTALKFIGILCLLFIGLVIFFCGANRKRVPRV